MTPTTLVPADERRSFWLATAPPVTPYPALATNLVVDVAVIGAGIVGITAATLLAEAGRSVALLEARRVASGVTGHTTAKVTSLHTLIYDLLVRRVGEEGARAYAEANEAALDLIRRLCREREIDCDLAEASAYTFAVEDDDVERVEREVEAALSLGLPAAHVADVPLPFPTRGAVRFDGQAQFHPRRYLLPLVARLAESGAGVFEESRVVSIDCGNRCRVTTTSGHVVSADRVIIATHAPIIDSKLLVARAKVERGYALALESAETVAEGMFISASSPTHSIRSARLEDRNVLIVAGEGHPVGESGTSELAASQRLEDWAQRRLGAGKVLFRWSTQDYYSLDHIPFVGALDKGKRLLTATAFGGWGMTGGTAAAMLLADLTLGVENPSAKLYDPRRLKPATLPRLFAKGAKDATRLVGDRLRASENAGSLGELGSGQARIVKLAGERLAVHRATDGSLQVVSAVCTHLKCLVRWNDAEESWDCPCHGSRFSPSGAVLQGPATRPLPDRRDILPP